MYRQSDDLRFVKNREALQRAFIDLTLEKQSARITVKELAERAGVNRMTFYSHYDEVFDVLAEFVDGLAAEIVGSWASGDETIECGDRSGKEGAGKDASASEGASEGEGAGASEHAQSIGAILQRATDAMQHEMEFYRLVARDARFEPYRAQFREAFSAIFAKQLEGAAESDAEQTSVQRRLTADMLASAITYSYLDWLAGKYGLLPLEELIPLCEDFVSVQLLAKTAIIDK